MTTPNAAGPNLAVVPDAPDLDPALFTVTTFTEDEAGMWTDHVNDQYQVKAGPVVGIEMGYHNGRPDVSEIVFITADGTRYCPVDPGPGQFRSIVLDGKPYTGDPAY